MQVFSGNSGVYVKFEAKGDTNAVDSPSELYITVGWQCQAVKLLHGSKAVRCLPCLMP
jgi:hypothetical protein